MTRRAAIRALALALLQAGGAPAFAEPASAVHVVVLGSSTAAGIGPSHPDSAWVERYRAALAAIDPDHQVTNLAVGGYTTYHILPTGHEVPAGRPDPDPDHNVTRALQLAPDAIVVNLPSNDVAFGYSIGEQIANYESVRLAAAAAGVPVYLATSQPRNLSQELRDSLVAMRDTTLALYGSWAVDFWTGIADQNNGILGTFDSGDGVHLNDAAHRILFERVMLEDIHRIYFVGVAGPPAASVALLPVHPLPARDSATIRFTLDRDAEVTIALIDVRGRRRAVVAQGRRAAGAHAIPVDTRALGAGLYFCVIESAGGHRAVARLLVLP